MLTFRTWLLTEAKDSEPAKALDEKAFIHHRGVAFEGYLAQRMLGGKHPKPIRGGRSPEEDLNDSEHALTSLMGHEYVERLKGLAEHAHNALKDHLHKEFGEGWELVGVHRTSKPGDIKAVTGYPLSQTQEAGDVVATVKDKDGNHRYVFISAKTFGKPRAKVPVGNPGLTSLMNNHGASTENHKNVEGYRKKRDEALGEFYKKQGIAGFSREEKKSHIKQMNKEYRNLQKELSQEKDPERRERIKHDLHHHPAAELSNIHRNFFQSAAPHVAASLREQQASDPQGFLTSLQRSVRQQQHKAHEDGHKSIIVKSWWGGGDKSGKGRPETHIVDSVHPALTEPSGHVITTRGSSIIVTHPNHPGFRVIHRLKNESGSSPNPSIKADTTIQTDLGHTAIRAAARREQEAADKAKRAAAKAEKAASRVETPETKRNKNPTVEVHPNT